MVTLCVERIPIARAAPDEMSSVTPGVNGPRSFTRTATFRPVLGLPTMMQVPNGNDRCAAVIPPGLNICPTRCGVLEVHFRTTSHAPLDRHVMVSLGRP